MGLLVSATAMVALSYLCLLAHIAIHNCVHRTFLRDRRLNRWAGLALAASQLTHFEGWRSAHLLHHRHTNTELDPHCPDRPLLLYLLTHYYRIMRSVWNPQQWLLAVLPPLFVAGAFAALVALFGGGARGLLWVVLYWIIPVTIGHLLVAHFNYITHVGLPSNRGENTRDFHGGIWTLINKLTFSFYLHKQHHLRPREAIPRLAQGEADQGAAR